MSDDAAERRLIGKVVGIFARHGASEIRACGDDRLPRPDPIRGKGVIVVPDVTAVLPDASGVRPAMAMSIGSRRLGTSASPTYSRGQASLYILVRVETEARLEEPTRDECWSALAHQAERLGAELWFAADVTLQERLEELLASVVEDAVLLPV